MRLATGKPQGSAMRTLALTFFVATLGGVAAGCAHQPPPVLAPDAPLGRVVVYRNGVAYFERHAVVDGELSLKVPRARVDDFLKSLTVVDVSDETPLAISYATPRETGGQYVDMAIELPKGRREVRITYVTESPAWKPSYRVVLGAKDTARLQSWAVVDNVSGEAWDKVKVGVGSTSALSFRYDLHSVRVVERETIDHGNRLAQAPPTGGSAYAVAGEKQRVLANLSEQDLEVAPPSGGDFTQVVESSATASMDSAGRSVSMEEFRNVPVGTTTTGAKSSVAHKRRSRKRKDHRAPALDPLPAAQPSPRVPIGALDRLATELKSTGTRIRIEGNSVTGETAQMQSGLRRANTLREALVARGIETDRIDVIDGGAVVSDPSQAIRVVAVDDTPAPTQASSDGGDDGSPQGSAHFVAADPITLEPGHSAMVTLLDEKTAAKRVYVYDPDSERGSKKFAFNAVRIANPSDNTLDPGPVTVYADGQFLGEGLTDPIPPRATALVPYALDRTLKVRPKVDTKEEIQKLVKVERGIATTQTKRIRSTTLEIDNRGTQAATIYVRHAVPSGWELEDPPENVEQLGDDYLVPVQVGPGKRATLTLAEAMPITTSIDLKSWEGFRSVEVYLESGDVEAELAGQLRKVLKAHRHLRDLDDELVTQQEQMGVLRERVRELNVQLVTLRKVSKAQTLSSHLAKRMKAVSDDLDDATIAVTELQTKQLTARIELSNLVADLTLQPEPAPSGTTANAAPSP